MKEKMKLKMTELIIFIIFKQQSPTERSCVETNAGYDAYIWDSSRENFPIDILL